MACCALCLTACSGAAGEGDAGVDIPNDSAAAVADLASGDADASAPDLSPEGCGGLLVTADRQLDVSLQSVVVQGSVSTDGKPLGFDYRGWIRFVETTTKATRDVPIRPPGYVTAVTPGVYDVLYVPDLSSFSTDCRGKASSNPSPFPCSGGLLKKAIPLASTQTLDLDVQTVQVTGSVKVGGAPLLDSPLGRGRLTIRHGGDEADTALSLNLGPMGAYEFTTRLMKGTYEAYFEGAPACSGAVVPCSSGVVKTNLAFFADTNIDIDLANARTAGAVTVGGAAIADVSGAPGRGSIIYRAANGTQFGASFGATGATTYTAGMFPGTYDIWYVPNDACPGAQLPCVGGLIKKGVVVAGDFDGSVDIGVAEVSGAITVLGAPLETTASPRGALSFTNLETGAFHALELGSTGPRSYTLRVVPGHYDIGYVAPPGGPPGTQLPSGSANLKKNVSLTANTTLNIDIPVVALSGSVTNNGSPLEDDVVSRGRVWLAQPDVGTGALIPLGSAGNVAYSVRLVPGDYQLVYAPNACLASGKLPCNSASWKTVSVSAVGTLDLDIPTVGISGGVTLNGAALDDQPSTGRGQLSFHRPGDVGLAAPLTDTGPATYATRLIAGSYVIDWNLQGSAYCGVDATYDAKMPPCTGQVAKGCGVK